MRLSEAMMLGSVTCKMVPGDWNSCAIGAACNAVGIVPDFNFVIFGERIESWQRIHAIDEAWPWLADNPVESNDSFRDDITETFDDLVCFGEMTIEQLVDYVSSVEPSCGECNRFDCSCVKAEAAPVAEEVTA